MLLSEKCFEDDEVLAIGLDDGYFPPYKKGKTVLVAVLFQGKRPAEIEMDLITIDGDDGTQKASELIQKISKSYKDLDKVVFLDGVTYAGFNYIDPFELKNNTGTDALIVFYKLPIEKKVQEALRKHFPDYTKRWRVIRTVITNAERIITNKGPIDYFTTIKNDKSLVYHLISYYQFYSRIPEPLRLSDAIAREVSLYLRSLNLLP